MPFFAFLAAPIDHVYIIVGVPPIMWVGFLYKIFAHNPLAIMRFVVYGCVPYSVFMLGLLALYFFISPGKVLKFFSSPQRAIRRSIRPIMVSFVGRDRGEWWMSLFGVVKYRDEDERKVPLLRLCVKKECCLMRTMLFCFKVTAAKSGEREKSPLQYYD